MPKTDAKPQSEAFICPNCAGQRFQVHECGAVLMGDGVVTVVYDEVKAQCLNCHVVHVLPVTGAVDYVL